MDLVDQNPRLKQDYGIELEKKNCLEKYGVSSLYNTTKSIYNETEGWICPAYFDTILCWPPTKANHLVSKKCPDYLIGFDANYNATRLCTESGNWFTDDKYGYWTNYTQCYDDELTTIVDNLPKHYNATIISKYLPYLKQISSTGYAISLCALLIAFLIMFSMKKLHCPRNKLHMHLFASFIFRAGLSLFKNVAFVEGVGLARDFANQDGKSYFFVDNLSNNWECKLITSLWQYFITANYSWILMEGLYLHNLIFRALFTDPSKNIRSYIILGWGLPAAVILTWVIYRIKLDDTLCWTTHSSVSFLIIRIPTIISILINLGLFVRIAAVIFSKLQAPVYEEAQRYRKWARSTLVLVPLFGIHYSIFLGMSFFIDVNEIVELLWLMGDQIFASFQGFFVAVLYCFLNTEVRAELKPHVHNVLLYLATNSCMRFVFPCRDRYLRSAKGRMSVCTTISCSSVCNNGLTHPRNVRSKCDVHHSKLSLNDRSRDHMCKSNVKSVQDMPISWRKSPSGEIIKLPLTMNHCSDEAALCAEKKHKSKSESQIVDEEHSMLPAQT